MHEVRLASVIKDSKNHERIDQHEEQENILLKKHDISRIQYVRPRNMPDKKDAW